MRHKRFMIASSVAFGVLLGVAVPGFGHAVPPPNTPTGGDKYYCDVKKDGNDLNIGTMDFTGTDNDVHVVVCFETGTSQEFQNAGDVPQTPPGTAVAGYRCSAHPTSVPAWTVANVVVTWTSNGSNTHYEEREVSR